MNDKKRPVSVAIIGLLCIAVGATAVVFHLGELRGGDVFSSGAIWVELVELAAIVSGIFVLRGDNWARWVAVAWIASHVVLSAFHAISEFMIHLLFCAVISWVLFRPEARRYFRANQQPH